MLRKQFYLISVTTVLALVINAYCAPPMNDSNSKSAFSSYQGKWVNGDGDRENLELLDKAFESFHVSAEMASLPLLYKRDWDGFIEGHTWYGWWLQNSYGPSYSLMPFLGQEPYATWIRHAQGLWFRMMGDGKRPGYRGYVAPDGALMDCAKIMMHGKIEDGVGAREQVEGMNPFDGSIWKEYPIYRQGDGNTKTYDWFVGATAAGLIMEAERLLMKRDPDEIAERLPQLKRVAAFLDSRRDKSNNLLKGGRSSNLLAPGYGGVKQPDGTYALAYLTELSVNYCGGLQRLAEVCEMAGDKKSATQYRKTMELVQKALPILMENDEYFIMSMDDDGTRHGVFGAEKYGYFEATPNHDAVAMGVVDDATSKKIIDKMLSIPKLYPFDFILPNYPEYDDNDNSIIKPYGRWVDGGAWQTTQGRMSIACLRINRFDQPINAWKRQLKYMQAFRAIAPMSGRGSLPYGNSISQFKIITDVDCWGVPGGLLRGMFEYNYLSDGLQLRLHIPPGITRYIQKVPVWYGKTKVYISVTGNGDPKLAKANGKSCKIKNGWITLKPDAKEGNMCVEIVCGDAKESGAWKPVIKPALKLPDSPDFWEVEGFVSPIYEHVKVKTVYNFYDKMKKAGFQDTYEGALARVVLEVLLARHNRIKGLENGSITIPKLERCPPAEEEEVSSRYVKQARFMTGGLMDRLTGIAVWKEKVDPQIMKIAQESGLLIPD